MPELTGWQPGVSLSGACALLAWLRLYVCCLVPYLCLCLCVYVCVCF